MCLNISIPFSVTKMSAALKLFDMGFAVIPVESETKTPVCKWSTWENDQSIEHIKAHWSNNPDHDIGIITTGLFILDADSPAGVAALHKLEKQCGLQSNAIVQTNKGEHHYYKLPAGITAKARGFNTDLAPEKIDIRANRSVIIAPGSKNKSVQKWQIESKDELTFATQEFVDAINSHNGEHTRANTNTQESTSHTLTDPSNDDWKLLSQILTFIQPEDYSIWTDVGMALHRITNGNDQGLTQYDEWSANGSTYKGHKEIESKWKSFNSDRIGGLGMGSLIHYAEQEGADIDELRNNSVEQFTPQVTIVIEPPLPNTHTPDIDVATNPLQKYSLQGQSDKLDEISANHHTIMYGIVATGQATVFYAKPNSGKTLCTIAALLNAKASGELTNILSHYLNMDDSAKGLAEKNKLLEDADIHLIANGYNGFDVEQSHQLLEELSNHPNASQILLVMDTLTSFVDAMKATECRKFSARVRAFVSKGGTVIALAHTNKNKDDNGKLVPGGVANILNDFDCAYTIDCPEVPSESNTKVALFENIKRRGNVVLEAAFRYANETDISYDELVASVQPIDPSDIGKIKQEAKLSSDNDAILAIKKCITEGVVMKMALATKASELAGASKRSMIKLIDDYTGDDPTQHLWTFEVKARGAKHFKLLEPLDDQ